jgi:hypothetical protein
VARRQQSCGWQRGWQRHSGARCKCTGQADRSAGAGSHEHCWGGRQARPHCFASASLYPPRPGDMLQGSSHICQLLAVDGCARYSQLTSASGSQLICFNGYGTDCRHTGEHVREAVDVVRKSDNGLGSVGKKVEEVQDSLEHAQVGFCLNCIRKYHIVKHDQPAGCACAGCFPLPQRFCQ